MKKAVFLDRDGVINDLIYNGNTNEFEPPHITEDIKIYDGVLESISELSENGYEIFIISNQPDHAKGKTSLENLQIVKKVILEILNSDKEIIKEDFYCFHHPDGITEGYSFDCECRKPKTMFIDQAVDKYSIDRSKSWMIGDRETDIECGINSGLHTILIKNRYNNYKNSIKSDFISEDLRSAVRVILKK